MAETVTPDDLAEYLAEYPRQGQVRIYLDGTAKPSTVANLVTPNCFLGAAGLLRQEGSTKYGARHLWVDRADLDELMNTLGDLAAGYIVPVTKGQTTTLEALYLQVRAAQATAQAA